MRICEAYSELGVMKIRRNPMNSLNISIRKWFYILVGLVTDNPKENTNEHKYTINQLSFVYLFIFPLHSSFMQNESQCANKTVYLLDQVDIVWMIISPWICIWDAWHFQFVGKCCRKAYLKFRISYKSHNFSNHFVNNFQFLCECKSLN